MNNEEGWQHFIKLCQKAAELGRLAELYQVMFTPEEREQLATRTLLTKALLKENMTQREISADLGISITKITRGSNALKIIDNDLKNFIKQHS